MAHSGFAGGLPPVQWSVLRYVDRVRGAAASADGLAAFHGTTAAPASRTVQSIIAKGLAMMAADPTDHRRNLIGLTAKGRAKLENDPADRMVAILAELPVDQRDALAAALEHIVLSLLTADRPDALRFVSARVPS